MTPLFVWQTTFLTQIASVDDQHQRLVALINDLGEQVVTSTEIEPGRISEARDHLSEYVEFHFSDEEALLEKYGVDPRHVERHRTAHHTFVSDLADSFHEPRQIDLTRARKIAEYLVRWLAFHILDVDQAMARQIRAIKEGCSPAEAFERDEKTNQLGTEPLLAALSGLFYAVSERNHELRAINYELERRVMQRTEELEEANRQLQILATHDELTGIPNRRFAALVLNQLWEERTRYGGVFAIILLDADRFKAVNDRFGHPQGDALLRALAERLKGSIRRCDFACRLGGDEFLVVCPRVDGNGATVVADRILQSATALSTPEGEQCWDGAVSIGVAEIASGMQRVEELLERADAALYAAKQRGGARVVDASTLD